MHHWADLQSVHGFRCYDNIIREREMSATACTRSMPGLCFHVIKCLLPIALVVQVEQSFLCVRVCVRVRTITFELNDL